MGSEMFILATKARCLCTMLTTTFDPERVAYVDLGDLPTITLETLTRYLLRTDIELM